MLAVLETECTNGRLSNRETGEIEKQRETDRGKRERDRDRDRYRETEKERERIKDSSRICRSRTSAVGIDHCMRQRILEDIKDKMIVREEQDIDPNSNEIPICISKQCAKPVLSFYLPWDISLNMKL